MMDEIIESLQSSTIWSFPERGKWATHNPQYRGNFAPQIPRNIIQFYSEECDVVLDPMVGAGTTMVECKLLNRNGIGIDINPTVVEIAKQSINFDFQSDSSIEIYEGDVKNLECLENESIDLICTHPPYMNIISYSNGEIQDDLSRISSPKKFCDKFNNAVKEMWRVLKPNKFCAILIGDTRRRKHFVPLSHMVMDLFLLNGFILKEDIIKIQHNCTSTSRWVKRAQQDKFYLIMHEHLFVFRKPRNCEDLSLLRWSRIPHGNNTIIN